MGNLVIKKTVPKEDYDKFIKERLNTESQKKYLVNLHRFDAKQNFCVLHS